MNVVPSMTSAALGLASDGVVSGRISKYIGDDSVKDPFIQSLLNKFKTAILKLKNGGDVVECYNELVEIGLLIGKEEGTDPELALQTSINNARNYIKQYTGVTINDNRKVNQSSNVKFTAPQKKSNIIVDKLKQDEIDKAVDDVSNMPHAFSIYLTMVGSLNALANHMIIKMHKLMRPDRQKELEWMDLIEKTMPQPKSYKKSHEKWVNSRIEILSQQEYPWYKGKVKTAIDSLNPDFFDNFRNRKLVRLDGTIEAIGRAALDYFGFDISRLHIMLHNEMLQQKIDNANIKSLAYCTWLLLSYCVNFHDELINIGLIPYRKITQEQLADVFKDANGGKRSKYYNSVFANDMKQGRATHNFNCLAVICNEMLNGWHHMAKGFADCLYSEIRRKIASERYINSFESDDIRCKAGYREEITLLRQIGVYALKKKDKDGNELNEYANPIDDGLIWTVHLVWEGRSLESIKSLFLDDPNLYFPEMLKAHYMMYAEMCKHIKNGDITIEDVNIIMDKDSQRCIGNDETTAEPRKVRELSSRMMQQMKAEAERKRQEQQRAAAAKAEADAICKAEAERKKAEYEAGAEGRMIAALQSKFGKVSKLKKATVPTQPPRGKEKVKNDLHTEKKAEAAPNTADTHNTPSEPLQLAIDPGSARKFSNHWTVEEREYLLNHYRDPWEEIQQHIGRTRKSIYNKMLRMGLRRI